jgi:hypothetical protein
LDASQRGVQLQRVTQLRLRLLDPARWRAARSEEEKEGQDGNEPLHHISDKCDA